MKKKALLILSFISVFLLPFCGSYLKWGGLPPGYGHFPAQKVYDVPPFNEYCFMAASGAALLIIVFLAFPTLFGFQKPVLEKRLSKSAAKFPSWFLPSVIILVLSWFFMWGPVELVAPIAPYTFVPLWWSFILVLDGFVYYRNRGISLVSSKPVTIKLLAISSAGSWFAYEYLNFFVIENWYYPNNKIFSNFGNISWQLFSYTTVLPAIFEWFSLLKTFPGLKDRYSVGPKINVSRRGQFVLLVIGGGALFLTGYYPFELYWMLWLCLVPTMVPIMNLLGYWTPGSEIERNGNWSPVILIGFAALINGFFWEFWNYGSEFFHQGVNPNYWKYSVPYLDKYHFFSEMPVMGYFGYLFFGNECWVVWLFLAYVLDFDPSVTLEEINPDSAREYELEEVEENVFS